MPPRAKAKSRKSKRFSLYWVTTEDGSEDCIVVAASAKAAARFMEADSGYDPDDADAEHIADLPDELQSGAGWRDTRSGDFVAGAYYASDLLVIACGGVVVKQQTDAEREQLGEMVRDYRFGTRHFRPRDVVTTVKRALHIPEPHVEKRMEDRGFNEVELREMLESATTFRADVVEDRFVIVARFKGRRWEIVVEPDETNHVLVVVTACGVDR